jgi:tetratricopeptide (TPR) repeat protein
MKMPGLCVSGRKIATCPAPVPHRVAFIDVCRLYDAENPAHTVLSFRMSAAAQLQKAITCENSGDLAGALAEYQKIVRREPSNIDALFLLGRAHCRQGQFEAGAQAFRKIIKLMPAHAPAHTLLGMALFRLGKPEEALVSLEHGLAADPRFELALANKADVLAELGRHAEAVGEYDRALAVNAANPASWCNRGNALQSLGRNAEAVESFQRALALDPSLAEAHFNLANALLRLGRSEEALPHYRRAIALRPGAAEPYLNLAGALLALKRWQEAEQVSRQAVRLRPGMAKPYTDLAEALLVLKRWQEAEQLAEQAIRLEPNSVRAHSHLGSALFELGHHDRGLAEIDKALVLDPDSTGALHQKARFLLILGHVDEARVLLKRIVDLDPQRVDSCLLLADIWRFTPDDPLLRAMEHLLDGPGPLVREDRIGLQFAVAKAYGDIDKHAMSFEHLLEANALMRQQFDYDEPFWLGQLDHIERIFTAELLHSKSGNGDPSRQPIFIIGMPRSGSTLIEQILASHPRVHGAGERMDFSKVVFAVTGARPLDYPEFVPTLRPEQLDEIGAAYVASMTKSLPSVDRFTDKLLGNFVFAGLIRLVLPNAHIIHIQRNPIDTCWSCFSVRFSEPFEFAYDLGELGRFYRAYERLMEHWRRVLPEGAMLEVHYEDVVADIEAQARRIIDYCGLEWNDACLAFYKTSRPVRTASVAQVRQPIYKTSVERWRRYERHLGPLLEALGARADAL